MLLLALGCSDGCAPPPTAETGTHETVALVWPFATPVVDAGDALPGRTLVLTMVGAPPESEITFYRSDVGMGAGPCSERAVNCAEILEPYAVGTTTPTETGTASLEITIAADDEPKPVFFAAEVYSPESDSSIWTLPISRYISVPPEDAVAALRSTTQAAGIDIFTTGNSHTGGLAWPDFNGDLLPDLVVANGSGYPHRLYRNNGDGTFTVMPGAIDKPGLALEDAQASFADIENDGDVDIFFAVDSPTPMDSELVQPREGGPNLLYVNQGDGTFVEDAHGRGLVDPRGWRNIGAAWADFNADGFVDVYLATWAMNQAPGDRFGRLMLNDGTGHFVADGVDYNEGRDTLTLLAADTDVDGWSELYLGNVNKIVGFHDTNPLADDIFYDNVGGALVDVTHDSPGVGDDDWASMGIDVGDYDNDGDFDYYQTDRFLVDDPLPRGNTFYVNQGDDTYSDNACAEAKICTGYAGWPTGFADFDRDGWVDLWVGTGRDYAQDLLFINQRDGTFRSEAVSFFVNNATRGGAQADYDGDGDIDLAMWNYGDQTRLFANEGLDAHHWLEVKLVGRSANREAIGAVVRVVTPEGGQLRRVSGGDSAHSQSESILHFGLGGVAAPVDLTITWPGGAVQNVQDVPVDGLVIIDQLTGLEPEIVAHPEATWHDGVLTVIAKTNYGARTQLDTRYGSLGWDPETAQFIGAFAVTAPPEEIAVTTPRGAACPVPVILVP